MGLLMERAKRKVEDKVTNEIFEHIFRNAMGNPIIFKSAPSLLEMKANTWGVFETTIYIRFANATGISIAGVQLT